MMMEEMALVIAISGVFEAIASALAVTNPTMTPPIRPGRAPGPCAPPHVPPEISVCCCAPDANDSTTSIGVETPGDGPLPALGQRPDAHGPGADLGVGGGDRSHVGDLVGRRRDGSLFDVELTAAIAAAVSVPVIASGGVASIGDIRAVKTCESNGVSGVIVGMALYTGALDLREALRVASGGV